MNKSTYRINMIIAVLFFASVGLSAYMLFRMPYAIGIPSGSEAFATSLYIILAVTFLLGGVSIYRASQYKEELIVYKERTQEMKKAEAEAEEKKNEISLESVKSAMTSSHSVDEVLQNGLNAVCKQLGAGQGAAYIRKEEDGKVSVELQSGFALSLSEGNRPRFDLGEGIIGQAAESGQVLYLDEIPEGYIKIISGLGSASPRYVLVNPIKSQNGVVGVIEIAAFSAFSKEHRKFVEQSALLIAEEMSNKKG